MSEWGTADQLINKLTDAGLSRAEAFEWLGEVIRTEAMTLACRCGKLIIEPSEGCEWHDARIYRARELRKTVGSIAY